MKKLRKLLFRELLIGAIEEDGHKSLANKLGITEDALYMMKCQSRELLTPRLEKKLIAIS